MLEVSIGCDPELFVYDNQHKHFVSGHDFVPGTKQMPRQIEGGAIQADGVAAEFNIEPATSEDEFSTRIIEVVNSLDVMVFTYNPEYVLKAVPTAEFSKKYFKSLPQEATILGCEPDFCAYTGKKSPKPQGKNLLFRTGAGHVHCGWTFGEDIFDEGHLKDCMFVVKTMDAVLYASSFLWDNDNRRRQLYGKMGTFRPKPYGVEYRPLSNVWVRDPDLHKWIFYVARWCTRNALEVGSVLEDKRVKTMLALMENEKPTSQQARNFHKYMCGEFDLPLLPEEYLK